MLACVSTAATSVTSSDCKEARAISRPMAPSPITTTGTGPEFAALAIADRISRRFEGLCFYARPVRRGNQNGDDVSENSLFTQGVTTTQSASGSPSTMPSSASIPETTVPMMV